VPALDRRARHALRSRIGFKAKNRRHRRIQCVESYRFNSKQHLFTRAALPPV